MKMKEIENRPISFLAVTVTVHMLRCIFAFRMKTSNQFAVQCSLIFFMSEAGDYFVYCSVYYVLRLTMSMPICWLLIQVFAAIFLRSSLTQSYAHIFCGWSVALKITIQHFRSFFSVANPTLSYFPLKSRWDERMLFLCSVGVVVSDKIIYKIPLNQSAHYRHTYIDLYIYV